MHSKGDHKQNEKITYGLGKILTNDATKKGLISKIYSLIKKKIPSSQNNAQKT